MKNHSPLQQIQESSLRIMAPLESQKLFAVCVKDAVAMVGAKYGSLFLDKQGQLVRVFSTVPQLFRMTPRKNGYTHQAFLKGEIIFMDQETIKKTHPEAHHKSQTIILIPLTHKEKRLGVIALQSTISLKPKPELEQTLKLFGSLAALAIRNLELYESSQASLKNHELFMSTAAHELKTPLATIKAYAQISQKKLIQNEEVKQKWMDAIVSNSYRLENLIKDLFSASQMGMGVFSYDFSKKDISKTLAKSITDNIIYSKRVITFDNKLKGSEDLIHIDAEKLELVFNNVIGNAMKYSESNTPIKISLNKKKSYYLVKIKDQGKGIAKKDLPHVFDQYYQGRRNGTNGMGLGLYLSKQIMAAHHGEITIASKIGVGTMVTLYIPDENYSDSML